MRAEESIVVDRKAEDVFATVARVRDYASFCPQYRSTRVLLEGEGRLVLERVARVVFFPVRWVSEAVIEAPRVRIRQLEGPLKGMRTEWGVEPRGEGAKVTITHEFRLGLLFRPLERLVYQLIIRKMAQSALSGVKSFLEDSGRASEQVAVQE